MNFKPHHNYNLTKSQEEDRETLPRAVNRNNFFELLDGTWNFDLDANDRGLADEWYKAHEYNDTSEWPGSIEAHLAEKGHQTEAGWRDHVIAWYERDFEHPEKKQAGAPDCNW